MAKNPSAKSTAKGKTPTAINPLPEVKAKRERKRFEPSKPGHFEAKAATVAKTKKTPRKAKPSPSDVAPARVRRAPALAPPKTEPVVGVFARIPVSARKIASDAVGELHSLGLRTASFATLVGDLIVQYAPQYVAEVANERK